MLNSGGGGSCETACLKVPGRTVKVKGSYTTRGQNQTKLLRVAFIPLKWLIQK